MVKIAFIGGGKMAEALISKIGSPQSVVVSDISRKRLKYLKGRYKVKIARDNLSASQSAEMVVLAVKPQKVSEVLPEICRGKLLISIAAGISLKYLQKNLPGTAVIRAMPNNPCLAGAGMTALAKGRLVDRTSYKKAEKIFKAVGEVVAVPEEWMDAVTGLSGSGPAFVYEVIEALTEGGVDSGLPKKTAVGLAVQTVLGAAATVKMTGKAPEELQKMVASPGGTTIEGLKVLKKHKFSQILRAAVAAAARKSKKLSQ